MTATAPAAIARVVQALEERDRAHHQANQLIETAAEASAQAIRDARAAGVPWNQITEGTGLSRQRLWQILNGK